MRIRENLDDRIGVLRLVVDAGTALLSVIVAVPVAFVIGEVAENERRMSGEHPPCVPPGSPTHDLGTVVTYR